MAPFLAALIPSLVSGAAGLIGSIVQGNKQNKAIENTNKANKENTEDTNSMNWKIQDSINKYNQYIAQMNNIANADINESNNATNRLIMEKTNEANAANVQATNQANIDIANSTNLANQNIAKQTNEANAEIQKGINDTNIALTQATNDLNKSIANDNLAFQREKYEYDKALQQQLFEREDTSYARTAFDMSQAGLNPLQMGGTNGSGSVVSTSAPQNYFQAIVPTVSGHTAIGSTNVNPTLQAFQAQAATMSPYERKIAQATAAKMERFQAQTQSFDWLNNMVGHIQDSAMSALNHGIQLDQLKEAKLNNQVDRIAKLKGTGWYIDNGSLMPTVVVDNGKSYDPVSREAYHMAQEQKSYEHDFNYNLSNSSTDFERNITALQYMLDTKRIQSLGKSLYNQAFDIFGMMQKLSNAN